MGAAMVLIAHKTITLNIAPHEWDMVDKYQINIVAALHDGLTREIKQYIHAEKQLHMIK